MFFWWMQCFSLLWQSSSPCKHYATIPGQFNPSTLSTSTFFILLASSHLRGNRPRRPWPLVSRGEAEGGRVLGQSVVILIEILPRFESVLCVWRSGFSGMLVHHWRRSHFSIKENETNSWRNTKDRDASFEFCLFVHSLTDEWREERISLIPNSNDGGEGEGVLTRLF